MRAVILAGGKGTRLKPYTVVLPKPLMPIGDYPILEVVVRQLVYFGFNHITMAVSHQAEIIQAFFGDGEKWGITIDYSVEDKPLSTMGPLCLIPDLPDDFLMVNGDVLTDMDFKAFHDFHVTGGNIFTLASCRRELQSEYGVLDINEKGRLEAFREKPVVQYDVSMGVYMLNRQVIDYIPEGRPYGFDGLMTDLLRLKVPVAVKRFEGYWLDIGRHNDYARAIEEFEAKKDLFLKE